MPKRALSQATAFTLLELILVMAILVIVLALSATSLQRFYKSRALESEARQFLSLTRYAQSRAASEGIPITLWIDKKAGSYGARINVNYEKDDKKAVEFTLGKDLTIQSGGDQSLKKPSLVMTSKKLDDIEFKPDGFLDDSSLWVEIARKDVSTLWLAPDRSWSRYEIKSNNFFITQKR